MKAKQKLHQARLNEWAARFTRQKDSGLTVRQWCEQNNVSIHQYNYWKHLLKEEVVDQMLPDIVQVSFPSSSTDPALPQASSDSYVPIRTNRTNSTNCTKPNIRLCVDGVALELEPSIPEDFLRSLIRAVHYA